MSPIETKRLFVAVEFPKEIKQAIANIQKTCSLTGADVKWVEPENIHLTLKFLGSFISGKISAANEEILKQFSGQNKIETELSGLGCFPSLSKVRIIWIGLEDKDNKLASIADKLDGIFTQFGVEKEDRRFQPHITLGRVRSNKNLLALIEKINEANKNFNRINFTVNNITLFESKLSSSGPTYSIIHQTRLK